MTDGEFEHPPSYTRIDSFRTGSVEAAAGGEAGVVVADDEGNVVLIDAETRRPFAEAAGEVDVAVADRLFLLTADGLAAYDADGENVWTVDIDGEQVDADPETDDVYVETGQETFVRFDGESGKELGRFDQSHPDLAETPSTATADGRVAVALWTFLSVFSSTGEEMASVTLDGAAIDVGFLNGTVVVSLKDGQLIGYDGETEQWTREPGLTWLADAGEAALAGYDGQRTCLVDRNGDVSELGTVRGEPVAVTPDASLLVSEQNGTVTVYSVLDPEEGSIDVSIGTDTVSRQGSVVEVAFENHGDGPVETTASVDVDGATPARSSFTVTVPPDGRVDKRVSLRGIDDERESVTVTVTAEGEESTVTVPVESEQRDVSASVEPVRVDHGEVTREVAIANEGTVPLTDVAANDREIGTVRPGAEHTVRIQNEFPTSPVSVRTAELSPSAFGGEFPPTPTSIDVDVDENGLLVVSLVNDTAAPVLDEIGIENAHTVDGELSFEVEIAPGSEYRLAVPVLDGGERSVTVDTAAGRVSRHLSLDRTPGFEPSRTTDRSVSSVPDRDPLEEESNAVSVERSFSTETPTRGERFVEQLSVENGRDSAVHTELVVDDGAYRLPVSVSPGGDVVRKRDHAAFGEEMTVPSVRLESDDSDAFVPARSLSVGDGSLEPRLTWSPTAAGCELWYEFTTNDASWELSSVSFPDGPSVPLDVELPAAETRTGTVAVDWTPEEDVIRATVVGDRGEVETVVPNDSLIERASSPLDDLTVGVDVEWGDADQPNSNVYLRFENESDQPIRDVRFEPDGPDLDDWTVPKQVDEIAPGSDPTEYPLHLVPVGPNSSGEVEVRVTADEGAERVFTVRASADENAEVPPDSVTVEEKTSAAVSFPDSVSGRYR